MTVIETWENTPEELKIHTEYLSDTSDYEVILFDIETKKELARLIVMPKTEEGNRFLGIITEDNVKTIKTEIKD